MIDKKYLDQLQSSRSYQIFDRTVNVEYGLTSSLPTEVTTRVNSDQKLLYRDRFRDILCLIVAFTHYLLMGETNHEEKFSLFFQPMIQHSPLRLLVASEFAVAGFFVLSGRVLVRRYLAEIEAGYRACLSAWDRHRP